MIFPNFYKNKNKNKKKFQLLEYFQALEYSM